MKIRFLGAARAVTGSCFHLSINSRQLLVDCGMHQGENGHDINKVPFEFNPKEIEYVFLTHAHIDHSGMLPRLVKEGFKGKIFITEGTADLAEIMLYDSAHIQEKDAEEINLKNLRAGKEANAKPLYTTDDVRKTIPYFERKQYGKIEHLGGGLKYRFLDAGHILGSGSLELWYQDSPVERKILFSGDIGKKGNPIVNDPQGAEIADYIVMESTYGNRLHKGMKESIDELVEAIKVTFKRGGNVIIPSFAIGRTQDLLYYLNKLVREGRLYNIHVYIDSPLAERATQIYLSHPELFDKEAMDLIKNNKHTDGIKIHFTHSVQESQELNRVRSGIIIIAGSGMCEGGRIQHHLKHNLWRSESSVVFVGFQARGTLGRHIVEGASTIHILGEEIAVKAKIYTIGGFSAHADQKELLEWLGTYANHPQVFVVHGEEKVSLEFADLIKEKFGFITHVPHKDEEFEI